MKVQALGYRADDVIGSLFHSNSKVKENAEFIAVSIYRTSINV